MILIPKPREFYENDGSFTISGYTSLVLPPERLRVADAGAEQLRMEALMFAGVELSALRGEARRGDISMGLDGSLLAQSYTLEIRADGVGLLGGDAAGLMYGVQTLRQIIRQSGCALPCCRIVDRPAYETRGYYFDVSRGRMPKLSALKKLADDACLLKLNQLQLYIEHTYLFRDMSEMWRVGEPLSARDIMELDAYCADRGLELVPSLSCFGHLFELLHTKQWQELCELPGARDMPSTMPNRMHHHTLNADDPRSLELVKGMISEFAPLFTSRRFNLCADETFDLGKGRGKPRMDEVGERGFYIGFVGKLCEHITSLGRQPMFWGDIVVRFADALRELPPNVICLNWGYSPRETEDATRTLALAGATQYVCPGVAGWNEWMCRLRDSYDNIARMAEYGRRYGAVGLLNTDWGDYGHINDPCFSLPGMAYGAAMSWQQDAPAFDDINADISRLLYLDGSGSAVGLLADVQKHAIHSWQALVRHKEWIAGTLDGEESASPLKEAGGARTERANAALNGIAASLRLCGRGMDTASRGMLGKWLLAIEGIELCNAAGEAVATSTRDSALANRLERWFRLYQAMWRSACHESELWRVRDVIHWYADALR